MKKIITSSFILLATLLKGQYKVGYYYDNNGNRYQRYYVGGFRPANQDSVSPLDSLLNAPPESITGTIKEQEELATEHGITVYPNPTKDLIMVTITRAGTKESKNADMYLIDNNGKIIDRKKYSGSDISFDLSKNPPGNYYLKVLFDDGGKLNYNIVKVN